MWCPFPWQQLILEKQVKTNFDLMAVITPPSNVRTKLVNKNNVLICDTGILGKYDDVNKAAFH